MKKIKILYIVNSLCVGGIEKFVVDLSNSLDKSKYDVYILSFVNEFDLKSKLNLDVHFECLNYDKRFLKPHNMFWKSLHYMKFLRQYLKVVSPDIVHINCFSFNVLLTALVLRLFFKNIVYIKTQHSIGWYYGNNSLSARLHRFLEKVAYKLSNAHIVGVSKSVVANAKNNFEGFAKSISLIYNGVDLSKYCKNNKDKDIDRGVLGVSTTDILVVYVARFFCGKNHDFLVEIWNELVIKGYDNIKLLLLGDGVLFDNIKKQIGDLNLKNIICYGNCDNIASLLKICDFAVFPSSYEGFGIALLEKMASSLPVVVSDIPPFKEVIDSGIDGYILDLREKQDWIDTIIQLSQLREQRLSMGNLAQRKSQKFSLDNMTLNYNNLYLYLLHKNT